MINSDDSNLSNPPNRERGSVSLGYSKMFTAPRHHLDQIMQAYSEIKQEVGIEIYLPEDSSIVLFHETGFSGTYNLTLDKIWAAEV